MRRPLHIFLCCCPRDLSICAFVNANVSSACALCSDTETYSKGLETYGKFFANYTLNVTSPTFSAFFTPDVGIQDTQSTEKAFLKAYFLSQILKSLTQIGLRTTWKSTRASNYTNCKSDFTFKK